MRGIFWRLLVLGLAIGCSDSHGRDEDAGARPDAIARPDSPGGGCPGDMITCFDEVALGGPGCCGDVARPGVCVAGTIQCPSGTLQSFQCTGSWAAGTCGSSADTCDVPSECALRPRSCCGRCGSPTPEDMIALHRDRVSSYESMVCEGVGCPECAAPWDPYLLATCSGGACTAIDLHADARTECSTASDCALAPIRCCACGLLGLEEVVAFAPARGSIAQLVCDPDADCPPCAPDYGAMSATCEAGRCVVVPGD